MNGETLDFQVLEMYMYPWSHGDGYRFQRLFFGISRLIDIKYLIPSTFATHSVARLPKQVSAISPIPRKPYLNDELHLTSPHFCSLLFLEASLYPLLVQILIHSF